MDLSWLQLTGLGIGGIAVVLLLAGRLIPSWWVDKELKAKDAIIDRQQTVIDKNAATLDQILLNQQGEKESHATILHALESFQDAAEKARQQ